MNTDKTFLFFLSGSYIAKPQSGDSRRQCLIWSEAQDSFGIIKNVMTTFHLWIDFAFPPPQNNFSEQHTFS